MSEYKVKVITLERNFHNWKEEIRSFQTKELAMDFIRSSSKFDGITQTFAEPYNFKP